jgi:ribosome-binding protein aMBF1 (putative translation factor)
MTEAERASWAGFIRCELCNDKLHFDSRYEFSDLQVCPKCFHKLNEVKKKKPKHPLEDEFQTKFETDNKAKPKALRH